MRKNKRTLLILPVVVLALAAGGCGQSTETPATTVAAAETTAEETSATETVQSGGKSTDTQAVSDEDTGTDNSTAADLLAAVKTTQYFTDEPVPDEDVEKILAAGINTTSGMNQQPWHFTAVSDSVILQEIADEMSRFMPGAPAPAASADTTKDEPANAPAETAAEEAKKAPSKAQIADAPLAIIISCKEGSELDAGLACQSMFAEATLLGYGAKIVSSPTIVLNGDNQAQYKELLGIPEDQAVATVLLVGMADTSVDSSLDGYTGASARNAMEDVVTFVSAE